MQISRWSTLLLGFSINPFFLDFDSEALFLTFLSSTTKSLKALFIFADFLTRSCAFGLSRSSIFFVFGLRTEDPPWNCSKFCEACVSWRCCSMASWKFCEAPRCVSWRCCSMASWPCCSCWIWVALASSCCYLMVVWRCCSMASWCYP